MMRLFWLAGAFVLGAAVLLPLRAILALDDGGFAARQVSGSLWSGQLADVAWRGVPLGDLAVGLAPLSFLTGAPRLGFDGPALTGTATADGVSDLSGTVDASGHTPLPIGRVDLKNVSIRFVGRTCTAASGSVAATAIGPAAGALGGTLQGLARCDAGSLLLPLDSATAQLQLRIDGNGGWQALVTVASVTETARAGLLAAGFAPTPQGLSRTFAGHL